MAFDGRHIVIAGLAEIILPERTVRLSDGGFVDWPGRGLFTAKDAEFGAIEAVDSVSEGINDQAPAGKLILLPPDITNAGALFRADAQGRPIRFWLAEVNGDTGAMIGAPQLMFDGLIDSIRLRFGRGTRHVDVEFVANAERLFNVREGNVLSTRFHQKAWPGEKGFDHCTGIPGGVPWGTPDPGRGTVSAGDRLRAQGGIFS